MIKIIFFCISFIYLSSNTIYFMPKDGKQAVKHIITSIKNAKQEINIAIYSFTNKKIAKALKKSAKKGINVNIIYDSKALQGKSRLKYLAKYKNISTYTLMGKRKKTKHGKKWYGKMHSKYILIDNKILFFGSANYSYSAFNASYETLYISEDKDLINKFDENFKLMLSRASKY